MQKCGNGILLISFTILSFTILGQQSSVSPYSRLGFGEFHPQDYSRTQAFGGANLALKSPLNLNPVNPASYIHTALTTFEVGMQFGLVEQRQLNPDVTLNNNTSGIRYFSFGIPLKSWWGTALGIQPYSFKGYEISTRRAGPEDIMIDDFFSGDGGLSRLYWGNAFRLAEGLSVGLNISYFFGNLEEMNSIVWDNGFYTSQIDEDARIRGLRLDYGAQYIYEIDENRDFGIGLTFANESGLNANVDRNAYITSSNGTSIDSLNTVQGFDGELVLPNEFGFGLTYGRKSATSYNYSWAVNADVHYYQGSGYRNYDGTADLVDGYRFEAGGFITPWLAQEGKNNRRNYFKLIEYRLGGFYENTPLSVAGTQLTDYGITIGFGLPVTRVQRTLGPQEKKSALIDIGAVLGRRGTLDNGLIQESYLNFYIGLAINDKWFIKSKYR